MYNMYEFDSTGDFITVVHTKDGGFRFFPMDIEIVKDFLDFEREKIDKQVKNKCGAV